MLALQMLFNTASLERNYPKSATVQNLVWLVKSQQFTRRVSPLASNNQLQSVAA
jgi:hypothetical protein